MGVLTGDWPRGQKVVLWVLGAFEELKADGLIASAYSLEEGGRQALAELEAEGFEPTAEEVDRAVEAIINYR